MIFPSQIHSQSPHQPNATDPDLVTPLPAEDNHIFQALFAAALDAMLIVDDQGCYLDANPAACQLLGLGRQDLIGCCLSDFAPPGFDFAPAWQQFLEQGQGRGEFSLIQPDGERREIEYTATANFIPHYHLLIWRDVTEFKRTEARLQTLENTLNQTVAAPPHNHPDSLEAMQKTDEERYRLQRIARHIPGVIYQFTLHPDGRCNFPYASEGLREMYGVPPEAVREDAAQVFETIHPDDLPRLNQAILESAQQLTPWHCEYRICHPDGRLLWAVGHSTPQRQPDGSTTWYGYIWDITPQKEVEQAWRESHIRLQLALEGANIGIWDWNLQTNEVVFSRQWKAMLGYEEDEIGNLLAEWESRVHPEDIQAIYRDIGQHIAGQTAVYQNEHRMQCKDGSYKWILDRGQVIERDEEGNPVRFIGIHYDITERKASELALQELTQQLQKAQEVAHLGHWSIDVVDEKLSWSEEVFRIFGMTPDQKEPTFTEHLQQIHPDDRAFLQERLTQALQGVPQNFDIRIVRPDGELCHINTRAEIQLREGEVVGIFGTAMDITERVQAEATLRASEDKLRSLFDLSPLGIALNDMQGKFIETNTAFETITGYNKEELTQLTYWELTPSQYADDEARQLELLQTTGRYGPYQKEYIHKAGHRVPVELMGMVVTGADGQQYIWSIIADITERKQAEAQLQEISERLSLSLKSGAIGCWEWNIIENTMIWDDRMYDLYGVTKDSDTRLAYDIWATRLHPDDREASESLIRQAVLGQAEFNPEFRVVHPDGRIHFIQAFGIVMRNAEGNPQKMMGVNFEITERKQAEAKLQLLLNRTQLLNQISTEIRNSLELDTILESAVQAIFAELKVDVCTFGWYRSELDPPMWEVIKECRHPDFPSWLGLFPLDGLEPLLATILRQQIYRLDMNNTAPDEGVQAFCQHMGITMYLNIPIHTIDGQIGAFDLGRVADDRPWQDDEIQLLQSIGTQVAIAIQQAQLYQESQAKSQELQRAYRELQETQVQLIQAEKMSSLGQLVAGVAHEINNPVNFIYGNLTHTLEYSDNLLELIQLYQDCHPNPPDAITEFSEDIDLDFLTEDLPKIISSMQNGVSRIRDIVKSLRTFSRLDEADCKEVDLHENIDSTLVILQNRFNGRGGNPPIHLIKQYGDLPLIECYSGLLNQVFMNLLVNAIEAIEDRQTREAADYTGVITITTALEDNWVSISIQDNGIGMSPEVQAKIFNPFFTTKPIGKGTGMGLSISYQIVTQNHEGELSCTSTPGVGTEFKIKLPLR
ncbi:PAS domain S-box protein [[Phormidium] sp. ETS-05]|uniref:PAS domain S-box protein n=1 Tax=[Phormidium] sp. ETS-05 TaxID=222819 RepID=UPI0018EEF30F|nr:PAS domain S-box protein [[Phormidium] sp. ETS-05]